MSHSSVLIHLAVIGHLDLLKVKFGEVIVPQAVWREVVIDGEGKPGACAALCGCAIGCGGVQIGRYGYRLQVRGVSGDATLLRAVRVVPLEMLSGSYWEGNANLDSEVRFAFAASRSLQGGGSLWAVEFEALPGSEGKRSSLTWKQIHLREI